MFKLRMRNNTDYQEWKEFDSKKDFEKFINKYYQGEEGNIYFEKWQWFDGNQWQDFEGKCYNKKEMWFMTALAEVAPTK